jgi:large subunit ribosomal protein L17
MRLALSDGHVDALRAANPEVPESAEDLTYCWARAAGRIRTTLAKAKELRPIAERMITRGREDTVHARRMVRRWLADRSLVKKLFDEVGPRFTDRPGGYLRILKMGPRPGDAAEMAILELVDYEPGEKKEPEKKKK